MRLNKTGRNRWVILVGAFAFKFPALTSWRDFLFGLLNNMNEAAWAPTMAGACPVLLSLPGGFLNVMPRARILSADEFDAAIAGALVSAEACVEMKPDSFGYLGGRLVCVDFGWRA